MQETLINCTSWTAVITSSTTDTILQPDVPSRLCFGPSSGVALSIGISVDAGEMIIVPSGVDASAVAVGSVAGHVVTGPFGA